MPSSQTIVADSPAGRIAYLDGLRGLAALAVVVAHVITAFFPALYFGAQGRPGFEIMDVIARSPVFVLYSGTFAVFVFFVLSGFVMARSADRTGLTLPTLIVRRYLRLAIPMLSSILIAWLLLQAFSDEAQSASQKVGHPWLAALFPAPAPSIAAALAEGTYQAFASGVSYFNPVLWTMQTELIGSLLIYFLYKVLPRRLLVPACVFLAVAFFLQLTMTGALACFFSGALIYEGWKRDLLRSRGVGLVAFALGIGLGGYPFAPVEGTPYEPIQSLFGSITSPFVGTRSFAATCLVVGACMLPRVQAVLSSRVPLFLGRISFALYLVHLPIIGTIMAAVYARSDPAVFGLALLAYFPAVIAIAYAFTLQVDERALRLLRSISVPVPRLALSKRDAMSNKPSKELR